MLEQSSAPPRVAVGHALTTPGCCCCRCCCCAPAPCVRAQGTPFADDTAEAHAVPQSGDYHYRANAGAEKHLNDPVAVAALQAAVKVRGACVALRLLLRRLLRLLLRLLLCRVLCLVLSCVLALRARV
jgi:hypothetical protein